RLKFATSRLLDSSTPRLLDFSMPRLLDLCSLAHSLKKHRGQVSLAGIRQDRNDGLPGKLGQLRQSHGHGRRGAAGNAAQDTFLPRQPPAKFNRLFVRDLLNPIDEREIEDLGDKTRSDSLDLV